MTTIVLPPRRVDETDSTSSIVLLNSLAGSIDYAAPFVDDPRLISGGHSGQRLQFNVPPRDGHVFTADVYSDRLDEHRAGPYSSYATIVAGDVEYYYDPDIGRPFLSPLLFDASSAVVRDDYVDPMGSYKPHFYGVPSSTCCDATRLSWIRDTNAHRQDLMARQIWRRNQTEPIYYKVDS